MFLPALYTLLRRLLSDVSGGNGDGEGDDDKGTDDKGTGGDDAKLKDTPSGDERGILDHLDTKTDEEKAAEEKAAADKKGDADDDKPPKLVFKDKPDWVATNFWDEKTGEVNVEALAKSQSDLRGKLAKGADKAPSKPEDYKFEIDDDLKGIEGRALMDGDDDPIVKWFRATAHEEGLSEATAAKFYSGFLRIAGELLPEPIDPKLVVKNLGPNGLGILKHTRDFGEHLLKLGVLNEDEHNAYLAWMQDDTDVRTIQKIREFYQEKAPPMGSTVPEGSSSRAELRAEMGKLIERADKGDQTAQADYEKLQEKYRKTYGEEPAGTSLPG